MSAILKASYDNNNVFATRLLPDNWQVRLRNLYAQPRRHYHTADHIAAMLELFHANKQYLRNPTAVHAIYDPSSTTRGENEESSIVLFREFVTEMNALPTLGVEQSDADLVEDMIRATITHTLPETMHRDRIRDHGGSCVSARKPSDSLKPTDGDASERQPKQMSDVNIPPKQQTQKSSVDAEQVVSSSVVPETTEDKPLIQTTSFVSQGPTAAATAKSSTPRGEDESRLDIPTRVDANPEPDFSMDDIAIFLDLDLSILAAPTSVYQRYMKAIRKEYSHFSNLEYREGRRKVLEGFMARKELYFSMLAKTHGWDLKARENIRMELNFLSSTAEM